MRRPILPALLTIGSVLLAGCGELHGAAVGARSPLPVATEAPSASPSPTATAAVVPPSPAPLPPAGGGAISFAGALAGAMQHPRVICEQHVPEGDGGFMSITGTVGGAQHVVSIWSRSGVAHEIYEGGDVGQIDYGPLYDSGSVTGFDWARGATVHATLPPGPGRPAGASLQVSGTIVCP
jgi:hypothetical protein